MKKLVLIILMNILCSTVFGQVVAEQPLHQTFIYVGTNFAPNSLLSYSGELGIWGIKSNTSFSGTLDFVPIESNIQTWIGAKAYYTFHTEDKLCYMIYIAPKFCIDKGLSTNKSIDQVLEFGFNPNYTLNKYFLLSVTLGNQVTAISQLNIFSSIGFVFLLPKPNK